MKVRDGMCCLDVSPSELVIRMGELEGKSGQWTFGGLEDVEVNWSNERCHGSAVALGGTIGIRKR
jgi:hypothetical protein